jgi:hypothetical protein
LKRAAVTALCLASCVTERGRGSDRPTSFSVSLTAGDPGAPDDRLPFSAAVTPFVFDVRALGADGSDFAWDGFVRTRVQPGRLLSVSGEVGANARMTDGRADAVEVEVAYAHGEARVWFEDVGYDPADPRDAACDDRVDQDGDGRFDFPDDPGCFASNDASEDDDRGGAGVSEALWFDNPRVADVQGRASGTPLDGESVTVDAGDLVVTRVAVDGLYVTDVAEPGGYGHLFLFSFSTPPFVRPCDRLSRMDGIVGEFFGYTELSFPSWEVAEWDESEPCAIPAPARVDAARLASPAAMESVEAGLVRVTDVVVGTMRACDENRDCQIDFDGAEGDCAAECEADVLCTEESQWRCHEQVAVALEGGAGPKVSLVLGGTVPGYDAAEHSGDRLASVTGTLRHVEFLEPAWLVEPRCPDDLVVDGAPVDEACVSRRTEAEDDP